MFGMQAWCMHASLLGIRTAISIRPGHVSKSNVLHEIFLKTDSTDKSRAACRPQTMMHMPHAFVHMHCKSETIYTYTFTYTVLLSNIILN